MLIYGAGGHAKVVMSLLKESGTAVNAVFDDDPLIKTINNISVLGTYDPNIFPNQRLIIAIGDNLIRKKLVALITHRFENAFHFSCLVEDNVQLGSGNVVLHRAVIQTNAVIGSHCIINTSAVIEHDCRVADFVHIAPGAVLCGHVAIGECTLIGAGSVVIPNVRIGKNCLIAAGSVITRNIPDGTIVRGNPARIVKMNTL